MQRLAGIIVKWLIGQEAIRESDYDLYEYAVHSFFLGIAPLIYAVVIGGIMGKLIFSIILVIPFIVIRKFSGGYHAKKEWVCLMSSCLLLYVCVYIASNMQHHMLFDGIVGLSVGWLIAFSPLDSENRRLEIWEKKRRKKEVVVLSMAFLVIYIGLLSGEEEQIANSIGMGIFLTVVLQIPCVLSKLTKMRGKMSFHGKKVEKQD